MAFNMNFNKDDLSGPQPAPDGWYDLQFIEFRQKATTSGDSINLNARFQIVNHPEHDGKQIFETMNMKMGKTINSFVHACGIPMELVLDGNQGTDKEQHTIPGVFEGANDPALENHPDKWKYHGPLTSQIFTAELYTDEFNGSKSNKVKQYKCTVPGCTEWHPTNLARKAKG